MSIFSETKVDKVNYSKFNLSHQRKFTFNAGNLIPNFMQECVPGDSWNISTNQLMRMMPMLSPVMHEVNITNHFFFVPLRILWKQSLFEKFMTGGDDGMAQVAFPTIKNVPANNLVVENYSRNKLADYLGLPPIQNTNQNPVYDEINPFPFLAYQLIYMEYYRDQNLEQWDIEDMDITQWPGYPMLDYNTLDAKHQALFTTLRRRAWQHDYFTSCLPWPQKGEPVRLPLGDEAQIVFRPDGYPSKILKTDGTTPPYLSDQLTTGSSIAFQDSLTGNNGGTLYTVDNSSQLYADLSEASSATIIEFRKAVVLQQWMEKRARSGSRYIEFVKADFNVNSSDARLQRPEFCGGNTNPVLISETLQTSSTTDSSTPLGEMAGHGISMGGSFVCSKFCEEHGFMIGLTSVMPKSGYHQGLPRIFKKFDRFDYATPMFQHVGEQEVTRGEIYYTGNPQSDAIGFGYIPRYSEYKFINNSVHGYFRNSLSFWTWDRSFDGAPTLSKEFVACQPSRDIFAITDEEEDTLLCQMFHTVDVNRPLAYWSDPALERL